jgi:cellulose synthase/poly-beta-1,6-N-acetylglucosamine synthase-like glycosyltransferase
MERNRIRVPTFLHGKPLFSVVVPTYDCPQPLRSCLEGLTALKFPRDQFEVIISDDGSPMAMEPVAAPFRDRLRLIVVTHPNRGPGAARNRGADRAQGTYLAFIDSDCIPAPDWLAALASRFAQTPDHLICGGIVNALPANPFSATTQLIVTSVHEYYARQREGERFFNSTNIAVPAERFRKLGGFDESLLTSEDYDLCHRWQHAGYEMTHAPEALVYHAHVLTFASFCRQHFRYGRGLFHCRLRIARRTGKPFKGERAGFYLRLLRFPLTRGQGSRGWLHALLVALSQAATAGGVLREFLAESWRTMSSRRAGTKTTHETR